MVCIDEGGKPVGGERNRSGGTVEEDIRLLSIYTVIRHVHHLLSQNGPPLKRTKKG